jgi:hypothetical protein
VKNAVTCRWGPPPIKKIPNFFGLFRFELCFAECPTKKKLGKDGFADYFFTVWSLPSVTFGKTFVECNYFFFFFEGKALGS